MVPNTGDGVGVDCMAVDNALSGTCSVYRFQFHFLKSREENSLSNSIRLVVDKGKFNESLALDFAPPLTRRGRSRYFEASIVAFSQVNSGDLSHSIRFQFGRFIPGLDS